MIRRYTIPCMGKVKNDKPLEGTKGSPLCAIPLDELPDYPEGLGHGYICLDYDLENGLAEIELDADEAVHDWLLALKPQLKNIAKAKGWKLDKTELEKIKKARE
ncbi:hypothetical protein ES708_06797 [subsurface metagenome]